ncbi:SOS response-associated peptidase [Paenibacillus oleatilyticus]|uniref:SOS response-associated peptidase n=1 Tax=Paenibacillus oleatilyticus TaxID=2594886 RepID=UPI001C1F856A|nr:SOS response-associated peptidase [Paenibacillus oleatilyticus]MBU7315934.1 SOS response-associated peptidase [Paenibacillus oleatilyticus]
MCGRYTVTVSFEELVLHFMLDRRPAPFQPRYNAAPGQWIPAIIGGAGDGVNRLGELRWGLVPSWAQDDKSGARMMNARAETAAEKPAFRGLLKRKRCLIPADGFYEWKRIGSRKQPVRFVLADGGLFGMAALYDTWLAEDRTKLHTCTILTTAANELVAEVHERMPVILPREHESLWLNRTVQDERELLPVLQPYPAERMRYYEVDPKVGRVSYNEPDCIEPLAL